MEINSQLSYVMFWRVTYKHVGTHVMTPTTTIDMFFKTKESLDNYINCIPEKDKYWYTVTDVLAIKQTRPDHPPRYFPLDKPIVFDCDTPDF